MDYEAKRQLIDSGIAREEGQEAISALSDGKFQEEIGREIRAIRYGLEVLGQERPSPQETLVVALEASRQAVGKQIDRMAGDGTEGTEA